jgi:uncharacterized membrane protein (UPF0182 family)
MWTTDGASASGQDWRTAAGERYTCVGQSRNRHLQEAIVAESLSRVPLSLEEEHTVGSMARWMRFMAVVGIIGGFMMLFALVVGAGLYANLHTVVAVGPTTDPRVAKIAALFAANGGLPYVLGFVLLVAAAVTLWQNMILFHAGDDFHLMATTDTADLDYLARGLDRLRSFFKIQVLAVIVALSLTLVTAIVIGIMIRST